VECVEDVKDPVMVMDGKKDYQEDVKSSSSLAECVEDVKDPVMVMDGKKEYQEDVKSSSSLVECVEDVKDPVMVMCVDDGKKEYQEDVKSSSSLMKCIDGGKTYQNVKNKKTESILVECHVGVNKKTSPNEIYKKTVSNIMDYAEVVKKDVVVECVVDDGKKNYQDEKSKSSADSVQQYADDGKKFQNVASSYSASISSPVECVDDIKKGYQEDDFAVVKEFMVFIAQMKTKLPRHELAYQLSNNHEGLECKFRLARNPGSSFTSSFFGEESTNYDLVDEQKRVAKKKIKKRKTRGRKSVVPINFDKLNDISVQKD